MEYNLYSNAEVTFSHLDQDADECFSKDSPSWTKTKRVITRNGWTLVLLAGLCFALLCGLTALGVLYVKKTNMSDFLEAQNMNLSASLSTVQQKLAATRPCRKCDSGWKKYQGQCYFFSNEKKTWTQSRDYCLSVGAQLVIINGQQEQTFVSESIIETYWIGLSDLETEGQWYWVDGTSLNTTETKFWYTRPDGIHEPDNWTGGEDPNGEDCASLGHEHGDFDQWFDAPCTEIKKYVCEK